MELSTAAGLYSYRLVAESGPFGGVSEESLKLNGEPLIVRNGTEANPFKGALKSDAKVLVDLSRSSLALVAKAHFFALGQIQPFLEELGRVGIFRPQPRAMTARTEKESWRLDPSLANFASWWRLQWQEKPESMQSALVEIAQVLPGFKSMSVQRRESDEHRLLKARWVNGDSPKDSIEFNFDELSDGQRILIALQSIAGVLSSTGGTLALDEPDNFLALAEIQPLIRSLLDASKVQVIVASHHPEVLNEMAREHGIRFWRERNGPVRHEKFVMPVESDLTPAEHIAQRLDENG